MSEFTKKVRAMLDAATQGPWEADTKYPHDCVVWGPGNDEFLANVDHAGPITPVLSGEEHVRMQLAYDIDITNAKLIAAAPTLLREACERIEKLEKVAEAAKDIVLYGNVEPDKGMDGDTLVDTWRFAVMQDALSALDAKEQS